MILLHLPLHCWVDPPSWALVKAGQQENSHFSDQKSKLFFFLIYNICFSEEIRQCGWAATGFIAYTNLEESEGEYKCLKYSKSWIYVLRFKKYRNVYLLCLLSFLHLDPYVSLPLVRIRISQILRGFFMFLGLCK